MLTKKMHYNAKGDDQLGKMVGQPCKGDVTKIHLVGVVVERNKPLFTIGKRAFFVRKEVRNVFLDTHVIGELAFLNLPIPGGGAVDAVNAATRKTATCPLTAILTQAVQGMNLGDSCTFSFVTNDKGMHGLSHIHRGHYFTDLPANTTVDLHVDLFCIIRNGREHFWPTHNALGGWSQE